MGLIDSGLSVFNRGFRFSSTYFRMDKYYSVVRKYVLATFLLLIKHSWKLEAIEAYNKILTSRGGPLW
jgi:hypothetical protein